MSFKESHSRNHEYVGLAQGSVASPRHQERYIAGLERALQIYEEEVRDLRGMVADQAAALSALRTAKQERDAIAQSTFWRLTRPLRILADLARGHYSVHSDPAKSEPATSQLPDWERLVGRGLSAASRSLNVFRADRAFTFATYPEPSPSERLRVTLVLPSLCNVREHREALIAFVLAAALAEEAGAQLRVLTRDQAPDPELLNTALEVHGVDVRADIDFDDLSLANEGCPVGVLDTEQFVTPAGAMATGLLETVSPVRLCVVVTEGPVGRSGGAGRDAWRRLLAQSGPHYLVNGKSMVENLTAQGMLPVRQHLSVLEIPEELPATAGGWREMMRSVTAQIVLR